MIVTFILNPVSIMARRTVNLPDSVEALARAAADEGESFSATVARLIEAGARASGADLPDSYIASGEGPEDLGRRVEHYLEQLVSAG